MGLKLISKSWGKTDNDIDRRYLDDIDLFEVSILDNTRTPAYYGTSVEARDNEEIHIEQRYTKDDIEVENMVLGTGTNKDEMELKLKLLNLELEL